MSNISAQDFNILLNNEHPGQAAPVVVDVREAIEYFTYNVGGCNIPLARLAEGAAKQLPNKNQPIIVICKAGIRSRTAQKLLQQMGYTQVQNLSGGLLALQKLK